MNFKIKNQENENVVIDIFGDIGESWFSEGVTMQFVKDQLKEAKGKPIELRVSSLGGSVDHALTIHDILKLHDAPVTAKILGATASSGTIIALGAHTVEMSENALFLIHNASTGVWGNAKELRETAEELDIWDKKIADIYKRKTGKRTTQILSLMGEERWIDASEAKIWGFIDKAFTPTGAVNSLSEEKKAKLLNDYNSQKLSKMNKKEFKGLNTVLGVDSLVIDEEKGTYLTEDQLTQIVDEITNSTSQVSTITQELGTAQNRVTELETEVGNQETIVTGLKTEITNAVASINKVLGTKIESLADITKEDENPLQAIKNEAERVPGLESEINNLKSNGLDLNNGEPNLLTPANPENKVRAKQVKEVEANMKKFGN